MLALKQTAKIEYPKAWRPVLQSVVLSAQSDVHTVESLCAALAHDDTDAGRVLEKLLEFLPRSIRNDGAIWKSDHYFWTDHRINYRKMVRARRNLKPIMESWKQKARGAPTWHYHLDPDEMVLRLARTLDCSTVYVRGLILQNQDVINPENDAKTLKNAKSITSDSESDSDLSDIHSSKSKTVTEIEFLLRGEGLAAATAATFAEMNILTVRRVIENVRDYEKAGKVRNKAAYLVGALKRELTSPGSTALTTPIGRPLTQSEGEYHGTDLIVAPVGKSLLDELESQVDEPYRKAWGTAKDQLRYQLDRATFDTWLADVRVIGVTPPPSPLPVNGEGEQEPLIFVLAVRNKFALDYCEGRLYRSVKRLLEDTGVGAVDVRFELAQQQAVNHEHR